MARTLMMSAWLVLIVMINGLRLGSSSRCRLGPEASTDYCALPYKLANFQGYYACQESVLIGRPATKQELAAMVKNFERVKAVGTGHSWWTEQFCSGSNSSAINIVTTELSHTLEAILRPVYYNASNLPPSNWPIIIDEKSQVVTVQAGVPQRILLDSLAMYKSSKAERGYTLAAFPSYIDQTVAGAISTGTHGSSFLHGSLSSQLSRIELASANGTLVNITRNSNSHLWRAAQIAVGRLGVITELEFPIMRQDLVKREVQEITLQMFVHTMTELQKHYNRLTKVQSKDEMAQLLATFEGTQLFWFVPKGTLLLISHPELQEQAKTLLPLFLNGSAPLLRRANISDTSQTPSTMETAHTEVFGEPVSNGSWSQHVFEQQTSAELPANINLATHLGDWSDAAYQTVTAVLPNGTFPRRQSLVSESAAISKSTDINPWDQYEFSISLSRVGDCWNQIAAAVSHKNSTAGLPIPGLLRFLGPEEAYLSNCNKEPRFLVNIDDHLAYPPGKTNHDLQRLVDIFAGPVCQGKLHWGKAGWPRLEPCYDGYTRLGTSWCNFGCAVKELDPKGKFEGQSSIWHWEASLNGASVDFSECCTSSGFSPQCKCSPRSNCQSAH